MAQGLSFHHGVNKKFPNIITFSIKKHLLKFDGVDLEFNG